MAKSRTRAKADKAESVGRKNLIINGALQVWQRGTSFTSAAAGYTADRFMHVNYSGATPNITKVAGHGDFPNAIRYTSISGAANHQIEIEYRAESTDLPKSGNLTLSYWVRGSKAGQVRAGRIINSGGAGNTGYGNIDITTSWNRVSVTVSAIDATSAQYYRCFLVDSTLSYFSENAVWLEIAGVQLEAGSVATDFEHRSYGEELALCKRYYEVLNVFDGDASAICNISFYNSTNVYGIIKWAVEKRVTPTVSLPPASALRVYRNGGSTFPTARYADMPDKHGFRISAVGITGGVINGAGWIQANTVITSPLAADAEL